MKVSVTLGFMLPLSVEQTLNDECEIYCNIYIYIYIYYIYIYSEVVDILNLTR